MTIPVNVDNFVRAESDRMFAAIAAGTGGVNLWHHERTPVTIEQQRVIRTNRDTLYSSAIVDISQGATLTLPDAGGRYLSAMVVNQDHFINQVLHRPGEHRLTVEDFDTSFVFVGVRILVDPADPDDVRAVQALQDALVLHAQAALPFTATDYDQTSRDRTRTALLELARGLPQFGGSFGSRAEVDPVHHLLGSAAGWGGLPDREASYVNVDPGLPVSDYELTVRDVPVDAFWSVTVYGADGYFIPNPRNIYSINSVTAVADADGSVTIRFGSSGDVNCLPIATGWNYTVRLYRPRPQVLDGSWTFPRVRPA